MTLSSRKMVPAVMGAVALTLSLSLAGCASNGGQTAAEGDAAATETEAAATDAAATEETGEAAQSEDLVIGEDAALGTGDVARAVLDGVDDSAIEEFDALPKSDSPIGMFDTIEFVESDKEEGKAIGDLMTYAYGGVTIDIPKSWKTSTDPQGMSFECPDYLAVAVITYDKKQSGVTYNMEAIGKSIPVEMQSAGYKNIKTLGYDPIYNKSKKCVGANVGFTAEVSGVPVFVFCTVVESKSYINFIEILVDANEAESHLDQLDAIYSSSRYKVGEAI